MKTNLKTLAAAVALCAAGSANAAIDIGFGDPRGSDIGVNMELFLSVWDPTRQVSMTRDLGMHFEDFVSTQKLVPHVWLGSDTTGNNSAACFDEEGRGDCTSFGQVFAGSNLNDLRWNVASANESNPDFTNLDTYGFVSTTRDPIEDIENAYRNDAQNSVGNAVGLTRNFAATVNREVNPALDLTLGFSAIEHPDAYADSGRWGTNLGSGLGNVDNTAGIGETNPFYQISMNEEFDKAIITPSGQFQLADNGDLTFTPIPVPPALWLLGSALAGLVGIARRKHVHKDEVLAG